MSYVGHPSERLFNNIVMLLAYATNIMRENNLINNGFRDFFFCCYFLIEALAQTGFLSNMNLFVLVSEGENNFGLLNSRDPLKYSNKTFLWTTIKLLIRSDILGPPLPGHQCCMAHWESMKSVPLSGADHLLPHKYEAVSVPFAQEQTLFLLTIMLFMLRSEDVLWFLFQL